MTIKPFTKTGLFINLLHEQVEVLTLVLARDLNSAEPIDVRSVLKINSTLTVAKDVLLRNLERKDYDAFVTCVEDILKKIGSHSVEKDEESLDTFYRSTEKLDKLIAKISDPID
jgi:hypothetical protein